MVKHCSRYYICKMSKDLKVSHECKCQKLYNAMKKKEEAKKAKKEEAKQITMVEHFLITETPKQEMERKDILI